MTRELFPLPNLPTIATSFNGPIPDDGFITTGSTAFSVAGFRPPWLQQRPRRRKRDTAGRVNNSIQNDENTSFVNDDNESAVASIRQGGNEDEISSIGASDGDRGVNNVDRSQNLLHRDHPYPYLFSFQSESSSTRRQQRKRRRKKKGEANIQITNKEDDESQLQQPAIEENLQSVLQANGDDSSQELANNDDSRDSSSTTTAKNKNDNDANKNETGYDNVELEATSDDDNNNNNSVTT